MFLNLNRDSIVLIVLLAIFLLVNVATATLYPEPYTDEIFYTDPAINLARGDGFTSAAWPSQSKDEFWSSNSPLYPILMAAWIKAFGSELIVTRVFAYILAVMSSIFLWIGLKNYNLVRSERLRNTCIIFFLMLFPVAYAYRSGRLDVLSLLLATSTFAAASLHSSKLRDALLIFSSLLTPWAFLSLVFCILTVLCVGLLFFGRKILRDAALIIFGISLGVILLLGFYLLNGSLERFLMITVGSGHTLLGQFAQYIIFDDDRVITKFKEFPLIYLKSLFFWPYTTLLAVITYLLLLIPKINRNKINYFFIALVLLIPFSLGVLGKYTWNYNWMHTSILAVGIFYSIDQLDWYKNTIILRSCTIPLFVSALIGWPWMMGIAFTEWDERSQEPIEQFAEKHINSNDTVVVNGYVYFPAKKRAKEVFTIAYGGGHGLREIPEEHKLSVNKMIIEENQFIRAQSKYGGQWKVTDEFYLALKDYGFFQYRFSDFRHWDTLVLYEREQ